MKILELLIALAFLGIVATASAEKFTQEQITEFRQAAAQGEVSAQYNLGNAYWNGEGVAQDYTQAIKWYHKAAEQGNTKAQFNLGWAYWGGEGVAIDYAEAVKWYHKVAEQGNAWAQFNLGYAYDEGKGVIQDTREAYIRYSIAKVYGNKNAAKSLRKLNRGNKLTRAEIKDAKREAAARMVNIDANKAAAEAASDQSAQ